MNKKSKAPSTPDLPPAKEPAADVAIIPPQPTKLEPALTEAEKEQKEYVQRVGSEIVKGTVEVAGKYRQLVAYIRLHTVAPKLVTAWLAPLGFERSRISEIKKIADAPANIYQAFMAEQIGYRGALKLTREAIDVVASVVPDAPKNAMAGIAEAQHQQDIAAEEAKAEKAEKADDRVADTLALKGAVNRAIKLMGKLKKSKFDFMADGFKVSIVKMKPAKPAKNQPAAS